jgi:hypothetical protein
MDFLTQLTRTFLDPTTRPQPKSNPVERELPNSDILDVPDEDNDPLPDIKVPKVMLQGTDIVVVSDKKRYYQVLGQDKAPYYVVMDNMNFGMRYSEWWPIIHNDGTTFMGTTNLQAFWNVCKEYDNQMDYGRRGTGHDEITASLVHYKNADQWMVYVTQRDPEIDHAPDLHYIEMFMNVATSPSAPMTTHRGLQRSHEYFVYMGHLTNPPPFHKDLPMTMHRFAAQVEAHEYGPSKMYILSHPFGSERNTLMTALWNRGILFFGTNLDQLVDGKGHGKFRTNVKLAVESAKNISDKPTRLGELTRLGEFIAGQVPTWKAQKGNRCSPILVNPTTNGWVLDNLSRTHSLMTATFMPNKGKFHFWIRDSVDDRHGDEVDKELNEELGWFFDYMQKNNPLPDCVAIDLQAFAKGQTQAFSSSVANVGPNMRAPCFYPSLPYVQRVTPDAYVGQLDDDFYCIAERYTKEPTRWTTFVKQEQSKRVVSAKSSLTHLTLSLNYLPDTEKWIFYLTCERPGPDANVSDASIACILVADRPTRSPVVRLHNVFLSSAYLLKVLQEHKKNSTQTAFPWHGAGDKEKSTSAQLYRFALFMLQAHYERTAIATPPLYAMAVDEKDSYAGGAASAGEKVYNKDPKELRVPGHSNQVLRLVKGATAKLYIYGRERSLTDAYKWLLRSVEGWHTFDIKAEAAHVPVPSWIPLADEKASTAARAFEIERDPSVPRYHAEFYDEKSKTTLLLSMERLVNLPIIKAWLTFVHYDQSVAKSGEETYTPIVDMLMKPQRKGRYPWIAYLTDNLDSTRFPEQKETELVAGFWLTTPPKDIFIQPGVRYHLLVKPCKRSAITKDVLVQPGVPSHSPPKPCERSEILLEFIAAVKKEIDKTKKMGSKTKG